jgi:hypothetical protein
MNLLTVVEGLSDLDVGLTIYARKPWSPSSQAMLSVEPEDGSCPEAARAGGLEYFIEVLIARDFLQDWISGCGEERSPVAQCERLIEYAVTDA